MTPDPFARSAHIKNPGSWNRYAFVNNDPINRIDPHGLNASGAGSGAGGSGATSGSANPTTYVVVANVKLADGGTEVTAENPNGDVCVADFDSSGNLTTIEFMGASGDMTMSGATFSAAMNAASEQVNGIISLQQEGISDANYVTAVEAVATGIATGTWLADAAGTIISTESAMAAQANALLGAISTATTFGTAQEVQQSEQFMQGVSQNISSWQTFSSFGSLYQPPSN